MEWCPDPLQPQHQWIKILEPGPWVIGMSNGPIPSHAYREWKCEPPADGNSDRQPVWHRRDWTAEGYRRIAPPQPQHQHRRCAAWSPATSADVHDAATVILNLIHAAPSAEVTWDDVITGPERLQSTAPHNSDTETSRPGNRPEPSDSEPPDMDNAPDV